jgi:hypothetical protein
MSKEGYAKLNDVVMGIIYSPLLVLTAWVEAHQANQIRWNRRHGEEDEDNRQEWEFVAEDVDFDLDDFWKEEVKQSTSDIKANSTTVEIRELKEQVAALTELVKSLSQGKDGAA